MRKVYGPPSPVTVFIPAEQAEFLNEGQVVVLAWAGYRCVAVTTKPIRSI